MVMRLWAIVTSALVAGLVAPAALAATSTSHAYSIEIHTVPALAGLRFSVAGETVRTRGNGVAQVYVDRPGIYVVSLPSAQASSGGKDVRFARWADDAFTATRSVTVRAPVTRLVAGFTVHYPVAFHFVDRSLDRIDPARVQSITITNSLGQERTFSGTAGRQLLMGSRVARLATGLTETEIQYSVARVTVDGMNVVNRGQQRFYPRRTPSFQVQLLFYSAHVQARDAFFRFPVGSAVRLTYGNGKVERYRLGPGSELVLPALPRGSYEITVEGPGVSITRPLDLSRDQDVDLAVLSYLDLAVVTGTIVLFTLGLLLAGRPNLRSRLGARVRQPPSLRAPRDAVVNARRARSTPKGLSAARSKVIKEWLADPDDGHARADRDVSEAGVPDR